MGILENIHNWFDTNPSVRAPFKSASMWIVGYGITQLTSTLPTLSPTQVGTVTAIIAVLGYVLHYMQSNTTWAIVGAATPVKKA